MWLQFANLSHFVMKEEKEEEHKIERGAKN
jgi:hypothetical protein